MWIDRAFVIAFLVEASHEYGDTKITRGKHSSHQQDPQRDRKFLELHEHKKREPDAHAETREHNDLSSGAKSPHQARQNKNACRTSHRNKNNYRHATISAGLPQVDLQINLAIDYSRRNPRLHPGGKKRLIRPHAVAQIRQLDHLNGCAGETQPQ